MFVQQLQQRYPYHLLTSTLACGNMIMPEREQHIDSPDKGVTEVIKLTALTKRTLQDLATLQYRHGMVLPIKHKGRTVDAEYGEESELFSADLFGPSVAVLDKALANITAAQKTQMKVMPTNSAWSSCTT